nr:hypothetical protein [Tanacetum cinerariifolium]
MERGFLSQKGSGVRRGVKEKRSNVSNIEVVKDGVVPSVAGDFGNAAMEVELPSVVDENVAKENQIPVENTTGLGSYPPLPTWVTSAGNAPGTIRNNPLTLKKWHPDENILQEDVITVPVWVKLYGVPITAFSEDGLSAIATKLGTPLMLDSYTSDMCMQSWGRSSLARVMIELRADVELKENIIVAMPKITREGHYTCNVRVEYEWKLPRCSSCKVSEHIHKECPKNTCAGEKKTGNKPSQASRGVSVGPKMAFKTQKEYRPVTKKPNTSSSGNKKKGVEPTIETSNLENNEASSSGSSFMNIDNDEEFASNTPIGEKIDKIERQIGEGKLRLLDNDGNPLVPTGIVESDSEVKVVFNETANLRIPMSGKDRSDKGKYVMSGCTTALDVVPWETDGESVLRESC